MRLCKFELSCFFSYFHHTKKIKEESQPIFCYRTLLSGQRGRSSKCTIVIIFANNTGDLDETASCRKEVPVQPFLQSIRIISMCNNYLANHMYHLDRKQSAKKIFQNSILTVINFFFPPFLFPFLSCFCFRGVAVAVVISSPFYQLIISPIHGARDIEVSPPKEEEALISKYFLSCFRQQCPVSGGGRKDRQMMIGSENSLTVNQTIWGK